MSDEKFFTAGDFSGTHHGWELLNTTQRDYAARTANAKVTTLVEENERLKRQLENLYANTVEAISR